VSIFEVTSVKGNYKVYVEREINSLLNNINESKKIVVTSESVAKTGSELAVALKAALVTLPDGGW
jgi:hypothetical protein